MNNSDQRIQDYIDGVLPADEKLAFEEQLKVDSDLQTDFREQMFLNKVLKKRLGSQTEELQITIAATEDNYRRGKKKKQKSWMIWLPLLGAALLLLVFNIYKRQSVDDLYNAPDMLSEVVRGGQLIESHYEQARDYYKNKDFKSARKQLDVLLEAEPDNLQYQFYKAITFYEEEDWQRAISELIPLAAGESVFKDEGLYYKAICHYRLKEIETAKSTLAKIEETSAIYDKATQLGKSWGN
ncbi:hypothetical protein ORI89_11305 [Sphingobacterium sp. UT-1RO-CII-1]|uniref:tetratricopeptide repeat protein n=1 Tax=Sphingobacterium sp. UT-1RO-CII-1 TaxID=2995225 RepID=UPI00227B4A0D|nr:tetratricopeptide repeat protein [Sphingobacterium sp. UT-1RO-CII-1]MCY4780240.1 hypothetical protein [Sphingobacterium sp. UT-1RO-CII-1]